MRHPFIAGERLYVRGLEENDLTSDYFQWFNDPDVCRYNSHHRFPNSMAKVERFFKRASESGKMAVFAIVLKEDDRHIGNIALDDINYIDRSASFAIIIGALDSWGKGYGLEAGRLIINHGFMTLNLHRICCGTSEKNIGMQKLAVALGMEKEGVRRKSLYKNGGYLDMIEYGMLREEFLKKEGY